MPTNPFERYLHLLQLVYVVHRAPAWATNLTRRAVAAANP